MHKQTAEDQRSLQLAYRFAISCNQNLILPFWALPDTWENSENHRNSILLNNELIGMSQFHNNQNLRFFDPKNLLAAQKNCLNCDFFFWIQCLMGNLAALAHLVYGEATSPLFQTFSTSLVRYSVLFLYLSCFYNFWRKTVCTFFNMSWAHVIWIWSNQIIVRPLCLHQYL